MKYTINKIIPETIDIDLSKPIYRILHGSMYYRLMAIDEKNTETLCVYEKQINAISNYSGTMDIINCTANYKECSEEEFMYATKQVLTLLGMGAILV